jgi:hypothetical protein
MNSYYGIRYRPAPPLAPYYRLHLDGWDDWPPVLYVPDAGLAGSEAGWQETDAATNTALKRATRGLAPWPAPVPSRVRVNGVPVEDPAAYAALFGGLLPGQAVLDRPAVTIRMTGVPAQWLDAARPVEYFPETRAIRVDHEWLRASDELVALIEGDLPGPAEGRGIPWVAALAIGGLLAAAGWAARRVRRRVPLRGV